jgi:hypothetical protein
MINFNALYLAGPLNHIANRGMKAQKALAKGPETRKRRGALVHQIVCKEAETFWRGRAALRGSRVITAEEITPAVNEQLRSMGHKPIRPKTVANTIAKAISGGFLRTG